MRTPELTDQSSTSHGSASGLMVSLRIYDQASPRDARRTKDLALESLHKTVARSGFNPETDGNFLQGEYRCEGTPPTETSPGVQPHTMWHLAWEPTEAVRRVLSMRARRN